MSEFIIRALPRAKLFLQINLISTLKSKEHEEPSWQSCFGPPSIFWGKGPKDSKPCSVSFAPQFKPRHINTYIGQIYKSGFGSLLMLLAPESLFDASSKTDFIPLGLFLLFVI